jgi:polysaccharide chain length determinant protein (PEP-CTERM system associated)
VANEVRIGESLAKLLGVWDRRKWLAVLVFSAVFTTSATATSVLPAIYQSDMTVNIVGQQVPPDVARPPLAGSPDARLRTISQEILSQARLERLINEFDLYPTLRTRLSSEALVERMRRDIDVKPIGDRSGNMVAFTIRYQGPDAETVAQVVNTLASSYVDENTKLRERQATSAADFVRAELEEVTAKLEQQERRISDFKREHGGELSPQMASNIQQLEALKAQLRLNGENQTRAQYQIDSAKSFRLASPIDPVMPTRPGRIQAPSSPEHVQLNKLKQELDKRRPELDELLVQFTERHPDVIQKRSQIRALEGKIAALERQISERPVAPSPSNAPIAPTPKDDPAVQMNQAIAQLEIELKSLREEDAELKAAITRYQVRVNNTPQRDQELQELSRDYDSTRDLYRSLLKRSQEAQLGKKLEQRQKGEQFQVKDKAVPATSPAAPNRPRLLLVSLALSIGVAAGLVLLAEQLDTSLHTLDELRAATIFPVLVSIPRIVTEADARRRWWRMSLATAVAVCGLALLGGTTYYVASGNEQLLRILSPGRF